MSQAPISVVTPTRQRPDHVAALLDNLREQTCVPAEVLIVDATSDGDDSTARAVAAAKRWHPGALHYLRSERGTAVQRNAGIERAQSPYVALIDDDIRLDARFFEHILRAFEADPDGRVGAVTGYRPEEHFTLESRQRWRWYRRLRLVKTFVPGRYDFATGLPINANMQPPFTGVRPVDFVAGGLTVWRRRVFDEGLRFDRFFADFGVLEDAHIALCAGQRGWLLRQCGDATCLHLHARAGRSSRRTIGRKSVVNYYYVFRDVAGPLSWSQRRRFWTFQTFELVRVAASALRHRRTADALELFGRCEGIVMAARLPARDA